MAKLRANKDFEQIVLLIEDARNKAFQKVNAELVQLYFRVGGIVSAKVSNGIWGENTVGDLAVYIEGKYPGLKGFNRRGLYRMKQFFEIYSGIDFISAFAKYLKKSKKDASAIVSIVLTQLNWHHIYFYYPRQKPQRKKYFIYKLRLRSIGQ